MIDISDGLSLDLARLCRASGVGAVLQENAIPVASLNRHEVELRHALHGGDEYQLLFTVPPRRRLPAEYKEIPLSLIGYIAEGDEFSTEHENGYTTELEPLGLAVLHPRRRPFPQRAPPQAMNLFPLCTCFLRCHPERSEGPQRSFKSPVPSQASQPPIDFHLSSRTARSGPELA